MNQFSLFTITVSRLFLTMVFLLAHGQAALAQIHHQIPLVMSASNPSQQGFVRIINYSDRAGTVRVHAIDDSGRRFGPISFSLDPNETRHFNSQDLERGNPSKGLSAGVGDGSGNWRLELETDLDIAPLAYVRTSDGFLTSIHEVAAAQGISMRYHVPIFNPASNTDQQSRLRLINLGSISAEIEIDGLDDKGRSPPMGTVSLTLLAGEARVLTAQQLEQGGSGFDGRFGDGEGKWQLFVSARTPLQVMSLLHSPTGNITNLSRGTSSSERSIPLVMSASNPSQQGFVRIINYSDRAGTVRVHAIDDSGRRFGPISFSLDPNETRHFNSQDLERGNPSKGLSAGVGDGSGNWRLELETDLDIAPLAYVRTSDGFLTSIHEVAAAQGISMRYHVPIFNPASNTDQQSRLRLINLGSISAEIEIDGLDDKGRSPPMGTVSLTLLAGEARVLTAQQLEQGGSGFDGRFGDGEGKWQLFVSARTPLQVMSLLLSPTGNITNLSGSSVVAADPSSRPVAHQVSLSSDLTTPYIEAQLIGTDPDGDTLMYVLDGPSSGPGYRDAFVQPNAGRLFAELDPGDRDRVEIPYKVTDGMLFSERALVIVTIQRTPSGGLGNLAQDLGEYGILDIDYFDLSDIPRAVDLSGNFPMAGNQGRQGSCVGWATAYALKSYQERVEEGWEFSDHTTFSPAWIYNQVKAPGPCGGTDPYDCGAYIHEALEFMVQKGTSTLSTMPYDDSDYRTQPSAAAVQEATRFKSRSMSSVRSVEHLKGSIANRHPIVIGMNVYSSFYRLSGPSSVYNNLQGDPGGGHAVTLVGYDDDKYGGAFKVINSWGQDWGDEGFFWLPYSTFSDSRLNAYAYVLVDGENDDDGEAPDPPTPPPCGQGDARPNLVPVSWTARYNSQLGGTGTWQYRVSNIGQATAATGVDVNLILSADQVADSSDHWVTWEEIPFELRPGFSAVRDADNPLSFRFPETIPAGTYYMALWVDDVNEVRECNETDNVSLGRNQVQFRSNLPDITVENWWAHWFTGSGNGQLQYRVINKGTATITDATWDINLVLHTLRNPADGAGRTYFLFYEDATHVLRPNQVIYRDSSKPASFNLYRDQFGNTVPSGTYYISLWVDDLGQVRESNEWNNLSTGINRVTIGGRGRSNEQQSDVVSQVDEETTSAAPELESTFNGKVLPDPLWRQVEIVDREDGTRELIFFAKQSQPEPSGATVGEPESQTSEDATHFEKSNSSSDIVIFPTAGVLRMP